MTRASHAGRPLLPRDLASVVLVRLRSIGDAVLMTPLVSALRRERPGTRIVVVLEDPAATLLTGHPDVDEVVVARRGIRGRLRTLRRIRSLRAELALDLHGGPTAAFLTRFSRARVRVGLDGYRRRAAYDVTLPSPFKGADRTTTLHTLESNRAVAHALGLEASRDFTPSLHASSEGDAEAARALALAGALEVGHVIVHPGAALASKAWPRERFLEVAKALARQGHAVLLVRPPAGTPGAPPDTDLAGEARDAPGVRNLPPVSLVALLSLLRRARLFIGNDSGPAHMAAAAGVATVTVFGSQDPRVWSPVARQGRVLAKGLPCCPCPGFTCANPIRFECLQSIGVPEVLAASLSLLDAARVPR